MRLQWYIWHLLGLFALLLVGKASRVKLVNNGYENVVIAISPDIPEAKGDKIINGIKEIIKETSKYLYKATHKRAFFLKVKILIPHSWSSISVTSNVMDETFESSDIRIKPANSAYKHQPYTHHSGNCGQQGWYIHLTQEFVIDKEIRNRWGKSGKVILQEWAKYRWGVFDEQGYDNDPKVPMFYEVQNSLENMIRPTSCTDKKVDGEVTCSDDSDGGKTLKEMNKMCSFTEYDNQTPESSIMAQHYFSKTSTKDSMVEFCDDADSNHPHNPDAPTKHNQKCGRRSVWAILRANKDFIGYVNPPNETYVEPQFEVAQETYPSYALVMDTSSSMNSSSRYLKLKRVATQWLQFLVPNNSQVALIKFSTSASMLHPLKNVTINNARDQLVNALNTFPNGYTSIGSGLLMAINTLRGKPNSIILLITDGKDNTYPKINDTMDKVKASRVRVVTVAFSEDADGNLENLANETNGKAFFVNDHDSYRQLVDAFESAQTYQPMPPKSEIVVLIHDPSSFQRNGTIRKSSFNVDETIGRNMEFRLTANRNQVTEKPKLVRPDGTEITDAKYVKEATLWVIKVDEAEKGLWQWKVGLSGVQDDAVSVRVTAQTRSAEISPITTEARLENYNQSKQGDTLIVYAEVRQGENPVLNATVKALVTLPHTLKPEVLLLLDNGSSVDKIKDDGIYSNILTNYNGPGRYSVVAQVEGNENTGVLGEFFTQKRKKRSTSVRQTEKPKYCCGSMIPIDEEEVSPTGKFSRVAAAGALNLANPPKVDDFLPPAQVVDLVVSFVDYLVENATYVNITLTWTATGDDLDLGTVSRYDIRTGPNATDLTDEAFDLDASMTSVIAVEVDVPFVWGGTPISVNVVVEDGENKELFFALRAVDDAGLKSPVSNVALLHIHEPEAVPQGLPVWAIVLIVIVICCLVGGAVVFISGRVTRATYAIRTVNPPEDGLKPVQCTENIPLPDV